MTNFDKIIDKIIEIEGGYVNDPDDPGGETKYGISKRSYPKVNIKKLTKEKAAAIYKKDWWDKLGLDDFDYVLAAKILNHTIHIGIQPGIKCLQRALNCASLEDSPLVEDGILGSKTKDVYFELNAYTDDTPILTSYASELACYYRFLNKPKYIKGWLKRAYDWSK